MNAPKAPPGVQVTRGKTTSITGQSRDARATGAAAATGSAAPLDPVKVGAALAAIRQQGETWRQYAYLLERIRRTQNLKELQFSLANEVYQLFPYTQSYVWRLKAGKSRLTTVSGLAKLGEDSPLTTWLHRLGRWLAEQLESDENPQPKFVQIGDVPDALQDGWREWLPEYLYVQPVVPRKLSGQDESQIMLGFVAFAIDDAPSDRTQDITNRVVTAYADAWLGFSTDRATRRPLRRWIGWAVAAAIVAVLLIPVRLSVLAPAEIVGLDAVAVNAPMEGVIEEFAVAPNQAVTKGQLLYTLDDTTLRNRREIAVRQLEVARADALAAQQKSFSDEASRADLASLAGAVAEKQAELTLVEEMLARIEVRAPGEGVAVFTDINDWQGKPVSTGERVMLLANPEQAGLLIWLPVPDAINLEAGAQVKTYLQVAPLSPLPAQLFETSYQAVPSPLGVQSYRLRARFDELEGSAQQLARIGLKGTAKIYGERAALGYYLFRRPLAALRRMTGL